eukprot:TRINITY_DN56515_c0_g1_i1.p1 TRINITY_DN56515_c0_g1~~TRINITY_DN56515_c0_g1_i1.p1  ORF type:complete len:474 (+),score=112.35 TRINITY_DN56515_c0_g1_i1:105-1526(+)
MIVVRAGVRSARRRHVAAAQAAAPAAALAAAALATASTVCWVLPPRALQRSSVALLIDGDHIGPAWFDSVLEAACSLTPEGRSPEPAICFAAPHLGSTWANDLRRCGLHFEAVRRENTWQLQDDPNDLALVLAAGRIAEEAPDVLIAIASKDTDFLQQHKRLQRKGVNSIALVPYASDEDRCLQAGVAVKRFRIEQSPPDFAEAFEAYFGRPYDLEEAQETFAAVGRALQTLGYLKQDERPFPTVKSLGLFFHVNEAEDVQLYPWCIGAFLAQERLCNAVPNPGGLAFFEASIGRRRPGSDGGWFVAAATPGIASEVLSWLGYKLGSWQTAEQRQEEVEAFWRRNSKALRNNLKRSPHQVPFNLKPDIKVTGKDTLAITEERLRFLELIFMDDRVRQQWRPPPDDRDMRLWLSRQQFLKQADASQAEVHHAVATLLQERGLRTPVHSYSLAVCLAQEAILGRRDPLSRASASE